MQLLLSIICSIVTFATADVAHLGRTYLPPARTVAFNAAQGYSTDNNFSERLTQLQVQPSINYALPAAAPQASYTSSSSFNTGFRAPARFTAPSTTTTSFTNQRFSSARLALPSRQYLSPEVETFEPIVQQAYSAPAITYNAPAATSSAKFTASSNYDTKYSADGGYVY